ncbi:hypothetical protein EGR_11070 [Echinococcus granulosus]|uniref:Uncharacterized protein n=1 Tax=Echinococcus granulosus TaxID=6210 RepID=W6TZ38_ECHGR|nr:hypothetical protein EGR_11070 [Echinococcus granulosus]EUB54070.1 hypothetical protein EGR_11070 [Echinococcus granulosus]
MWIASSFVDAKSSSLEWATSMACPKQEVKATLSEVKWVFGMTCHCDIVKGRNLDDRISEMQCKARVGGKVRAQFDASCDFVLQTHLKLVEI